jgi:carbamate kinase
VRVVIALGGNALLPRGTPPDERPQVEQLERISADLAHLATVHEVVFVHGNGPQVGLLALESAADLSLDRPYPLHDLVAETQGLIGYWIQQALGRHLRRPVVTLVSQTVVEKDDEAFHHPTKPVGSVYAEDEIRILAGRHGWATARDGDGWRRVVPSPRPVRIVESALCKALLDDGATVVAAGGGGIPVVKKGRGYAGVEAVVDKDLAAAELAVDLAADVLLILTDVPAVLADYGTPDQHPLRHVTPGELDETAFASGSMGPKVSAAKAFVTRTGGRAAIGALDEARSVFSGRAGTQVTTSGRPETAGHASGATRPVSRSHR